MEIEDYAHFPGWIALGVDAPILRDDVIVDIGGHPNTKGQNFKHPATAKSCHSMIWASCIWGGQSMRDIYPRDPNLEKICVYRKIGSHDEVRQAGDGLISNIHDTYRENSGRARRRRFPPHPYYSRELPLP